MRIIYEYVYACIALSNRLGKDSLMVASDDC